MSHLPSPALTQIKICGFTQAQNARAAAALGIDAIGLVFYPPSPRFVTIEQAQEIARALPPFVTLTALFLDASRQTIDDVLNAVPVSLLQFHGREPASFCDSFERPYIKSVPMASTDDVIAYCRQFPSARGFLLDSNMAGAAGGTGEAFDWSRIPSGLPAPTILAGGITPANAAEAIRQVRPAALDLSSGVESARGVKDIALIKQLVASVRSTATDPA